MQGAHRHKVNTDNRDNGEIAGFSSDAKHSAGDKLLTGKAPREHAGEVWTHQNSNTSRSGLRTITCERFDIAYFRSECRSVAFMSMCFLQANNVVGLGEGCDYAPSGFCFLCEP